MFNFFRKNEVNDIQDIVTNDIINTTNTKTPNTLKNNEHANTVYFKMWAPIFFKGNIKYVGDSSIVEYTGVLYISIFEGNQYISIIAIDEYYRNVDFAGVHLFHLLSKCSSLTQNEKKYVDDIINNLNGTWFYGNNNTLSSVLKYEDKKNKKISHKKPMRDANGKFTKKKD